MYGFISDYKKLSVPDRNDYKRRARIRYYARMNNLVIHKFCRQDKYLVYDDKGNTQLYNLDEVEQLVQDLRERYKVASQQLGVNKNGSNSENQS